MGKILITSGFDAFSRAKECISGFSINNTRVIFENYYCATFKKLKIDTKNIFCEGENFIIGSGTYIYKNKKDELALKSILGDFNANLDFRKNIVGSYCIAVYFDKKMYIFVDELAVYDIYYYMEENQFVLTNTYYHVAKTLSKIVVNPVGFVGNLLLNAIKEKTPIESVYKLNANEIIVIDGEKTYIDRLQERSYADARTYIDLINALYGDVSKLFASSALWMTGGEDARMCLAVMGYLGFKPVLYYGEGNSFLTCTKKEDFKIAEEISHLVKLPLKLMNWNDSDEINKREFIDKYGEMYLLYGFNKNIINEFENNINEEIISFGYFGEVYRVVESIEYYEKNTFTLFDYINDFCVRSKLIEEDFLGEYCSAIYDQWKEVCMQKEVDTNKMVKEDFQKLNTVYRQKYDTVMVNFANQYTYSIPFLGNKLLTDTAENVSFKERMYSKYQMKAIEELWPELLTVRFFSHIKFKVFNRKNYELRDKDFTGVFKEWVRPYVKSELLLYMLRKIYYYIQGDRKASVEVSESQKEKVNLIKKASDSRYLKWLNAEEFFKADIRLIKKFILLSGLMDVISDDT